jgi:serine beta-lactamase-like protein LACTB
MNMKLRSNQFHKTIQIILLLTLFSACENRSGHIRASGEYREVASKVSDAIHYEMVDKALNAVSIVLVKDMEILWARGFGVEDLNKSTKADANTVYRVGSVSKLFTDIGIMQLVEKGEVDLDAPITDYLPEFRPRSRFKREITLRQLMSHRSGLLREPLVGNYFDDDEPTLEATVKSIIDSDVIYAPESKIKYSNSAIATVGYVLEKLKGEPFASYLRKNVLLPMGLTHSAFEPLPDITNRLADATMWSYDGRVFDAPTFELGMSPAGSMYAPVVDLGQFMKVLFNDGKGPNGPVIKKETLQLMLTSQFNDGKDQRHNVGFGIGFSLSEQGGYKRVGHGGAVYGFSTQLYALPEVKLGVAVTSSVDVTNTITRRVATYALDCLLAVENGKPLPDYEKTSSVNEKTVALLAGHFVSDNGKRLKLINKYGTLYMENDRFQTRIRQLNGRLVTDSQISYGSPIDYDEDGRSVTMGSTVYNREKYLKPMPMPNAWQGLIGEYGWNHNILYIYEAYGKLTALIEWMEKDILTEVEKDVFAFPVKGGMYHGEKMRFKRDRNGIATQVQIENGPIFFRRDIGVDHGKTFRIDPLEPVGVLRKIALSASPPSEQKKNDPDLVELRTLDSTIKYDIRYATTNNFMSAVFYRSAHAYMQRPAAESLVRVSKKLKAFGYGLLIHDSYRPWYVTKMFWDATPDDKKIFVANPESGSRHNRGCAVDLTLYDLDTGAVVEMVGGYDEMTDRSFPDYVGGTSQQRWHRELLRRSMEAEGYTVYEAEWWHYDYKTWNDYPILNLTFEALEQ